MKKILQSLLVQLLILAVSAPAVSQLAGELLEKAIYTEETLGDPAAAIEIYKQILDDAESARALIAQAQYRLGVCYTKSGQDAEATAAFQRVIDDFADQTELVALARANLPGAPGAPTLEPVPWIDGEQLRLDLKLAAGRSIGMIFASTYAEEVDGLPAWRIDLRKFVFMGQNNQGISRVYAARDDFSPIRSLFKHNRIGHADAVYREGSVVIDSEELDEAKTVEFDGAVFDNEQAWHIFRRLPLSLGYRTTLSVIPPILGTELEFELEVVEKEIVTVPAGEFESYKLELPTLKQSYWISTDENRYVVRFEADGVIGELAKIGRRHPSESLPYRQDELGVAFDSPEGWYSYLTDVSQNSRKAAGVLLLDPDADLRGTVEIDHAPRDKERWTVQTRAERELEGCRQRFDAYTLRDASWTEREVGGRTAISFIGDYEENGEAMVQYRAYILSDDLSAEFIFKVAADRFALHQDALDSIVESYRARR